MSGSLRLSAGPAKRRLQKYLTEVPQITEPEEMATCEERIEHYERLRSEIQYSHRSISSAVSILERISERWLQMVEEAPE
ncbi:unnamed protein product [Gongylonema pulchrum]|uniref:Uncharacterized protein n=1 Tax=Gongylonema pulchrum TaxID=637853 RepID=A0A183DWC4_9BILA|nr:unnamed protein product [Gongylonema pulchrum]